MQKSSQTHHLLQTNKLTIIDPRDRNKLYITNHYDPFVGTQKSNCFPDTHGESSTMAPCPSASFALIPPHGQIASNRHAHQLGRLGSVETLEGAPHAKYIHTHIISQSIESRDSCIYICRLSSSSMRQAICQSRAASA